MGLLQAQTQQSEIETGSKILKHIFGTQNQPGKEQLILSKDFSTRSELTFVFLLVLLKVARKMAAYFAAHLLGLLECRIRWPLRAAESAGISSAR
ncbi:hypothetical protein L0152_01335 [bacterium]|nr:hypothetical protein [bacterium]